MILPNWNDEKHVWNDHVEKWIRRDLDETSMYGTMEEYVDELTKKKW